jgi:hypothetical protein
MFFATRSEVLRKKRPTIAMTGAAQEGSCLLYSACDEDEIGEQANTL